MNKFIVYNHKTGAKVGGPYTTRKRAQTALDKKDNAYGAYVHAIKEVLEVVV